MTRAPIGKVIPRTEPKAIEEAKRSYIHGACTVEELEEFVGRYLACDYPIPVELVARCAPSFLPRRTVLWS